MWQRCYFWSGDFLSLLVSYYRLECNNLHFPYIAIPYLFIVLSGIMISTCSTFPQVLLIYLYIFQHIAFQKPVLQVALLYFWVYYLMRLNFYKDHAHHQYRIKNVEGTGDSIWMKKLIKNVTFNSPLAQEYLPRQIQGSVYNIELCKMSEWNRKSLHAEWY